MFGLRGKRGRNSIAASFRTTEFQTQQEDLQMSSPPPGSSSSDAAMAAVTARITLVLDPAFFWAQVGRGRLVAYLRVYIMLLHAVQCSHVLGGRSCSLVHFSAGYAASVSRQSSSEVGAVGPG